MQSAAAALAASDTPRGAGLPHLGEQVEEARADAARGLGADDDQPKGVRARGHPGLFKVPPNDLGRARGGEGARGCICEASEGVSLKCAKACVWL